MTTAEKKAMMLEQIEAVLREHNCTIGSSIVDDMGDGVYVFSSKIVSGSVSFKAMKEIMRLHLQYTDIDVDLVDGKMYVNVTLDLNR